MVKTLNLAFLNQVGSSGDNASDPVPSSLKFLFPQGLAKPSEVPFPEPFKSCKRGHHLFMAGEPLVM